MILTENLTKKFDDFTAVKDVNLSVEKGEVLALLGPNGAGKTTCLRIIYTVLRADAGAAQVDGFDTRTQALEVQRRIGVLPDSTGLYPRLSTRENIRYYGNMHGLSGPALEKQIDRLIQLLDMQDIADRRKTAVTLPVEKADAWIVVAASHHVQPAIVVCIPPGHAGGVTAARRPTVV